MLSKEEIENENRKHIKEVLTIYKDYIMEFDNDNLCIVDILEYIKQLEVENTDLQKSVEQIYDDYQDAGKKMFEYSEQVEQLKKQRNELATILSDKEDKKQELIKKIENAIDFAKTSNGYIASTVKVECLENVLKILKGEKEQWELK